MSETTQERTDAYEAIREAMGMDADVDPQEVVGAVAHATASIQLCKGGHHYVATSHEYPCPQCTRDKTIAALESKLSAAEEREAEAVRGRTQETAAHIAAIRARRKAEAERDEARYTRDRAKDSEQKWRIYFADEQYRRQKVAAERDAAIKFQGALLDLYYQVCPMTWAVDASNPKMMVANIKRRVDDARRDARQTVAAAKRDADELRELITEHYEARQEVEEDLERMVEEDQDLELRAEQAEADLAAVREVVKAVLDVTPLWLPAQVDESNEQDMEECRALHMMHDRLQEALSTPHPGKSLLEELERLRTVVGAAKSVDAAAKRRDANPASLASRAELLLAIGDLCDALSALDAKEAQ